jgi:hypothetical protein
MRRRRSERRHYETQGPYGENIYSAGPEEYRGGNKRHPGLHGDGRQHPYYSENRNRREEGTGRYEERYDRYEEFTDEAPFPSGRRRDFYPEDREPVRKRRVFSDRGYGYHYDNMNESENYGRRNEAALYDDYGPEHLQEYRGRGYLVREHEGEYVQGIRDNIGNVRGFGRHRDDERDYSNQNYRNMPYWD